MKKWILRISASFDEKTNSFFKSWQSRPNEKIVLFPEKREKEIILRHIFKKKWNFFSKTVHYVILLFPKLSFPARKNKRGKKRKNSERFSVTQVNFDNDASLDVELMKENLTSSLEIDKIKWVLSLSFSLFLFTFLKL